MSGSEPKWTLAHGFCAKFNVSASELASRLKSEHDVSLAMLQLAVSDLSRLAKSLGDVTGSLPSYDQRQCELQLKALEKSIEELRATSATAPRFSFKRKPSKPKHSAGHEWVAGSSLIKAQSTQIEFPMALTRLSHRYLTILDVPLSDSSAEVSVSDLDSCIVNLFPREQDQAKITALYVQRVHKSVILLPHVSGSIILHDLSNCVVVVGCQQFRMHDSTEIDVYLECASDPIIEHSSNIRFAAYPSSLVREESLQDRKPFIVKDFSHILPTPSPNWSTLVKEEWEKSWPVSVLRDQPLREELERILPIPPLLVGSGL